MPYVIITKNVNKRSKDISEDKGQEKKRWWRENTRETMLDTNNRKGEKEHSN